MLINFNINLYLISFSFCIILLYLHRVCIYVFPGFMRRKRSSDIREQLGIFNINDKLTQYKINWREQIQRIDGNRLPKKNNKLQT